MDRVTRFEGDAEAASRADLGPDLPLKPLTYARLLEVPEPRVRLLAAVAMALAQSDVEPFFDDQRLLGRFLDILIHALSAHKGAIVTLEPRADGEAELRTLAARLELESIGPGDFSRSLVARAMASGKVVGGQDPRTDPAASAEPSILRTIGGPYVVVPLVAPRVRRRDGGADEAPRPFAAVFLVREQGAPSFDEDMSFLTLVCDLVAPLVYQSRLIRELQSSCDSAAEEKRSLEQELQKLRARLGDAAAYDRIVGKRSAAMLRCLERVAPAARSLQPVMICGESGVGKELLARAIHEHPDNPRAKRPFVAVNCGAMPETLIESELFGYERGAFTGAVAPRKGLLREAEGGTIFLDEITETPLKFQTDLLRVMQNGAVRPVGGNREEKVDVRVIAATNRDLDAEVKAGRFREDLFYRLNVIRIQVPPLRDRREDIPDLAAHFLREACKAEKRGDLGSFARDALAAMMGHSWPGNVRQLDNVVRQLVLYAPGPDITVRDLRLTDGAPAPVAASDTLPATLDAVERTLLRRAIEESGGRAQEAARRLGVHRSYVYLLAKKHGITVGESGSKKAPPRVDAGDKRAGPRPKKPERRSGGHTR